MDIKGAIQEPILGSKVHTNILHFGVCQKIKDFPKLDRVAPLVA